MYVNQDTQNTTEPRNQLKGRKQWAGFAVSSGYNWSLTYAM